MARLRISDAVRLKGPYRGWRHFLTAFSNSCYTERGQIKAQSKEEAEAKGPLGVRGQIHNHRQSSSKNGSLN